MIVENNSKIQKITFVSRIFKMKLKSTTRVFYPNFLRGTRVVGGIFKNNSFDAINVLAKHDENYMHQN